MKNSQFILILILFINAISCNKSYQSFSVEKKTAITNKLIFDNYDVAFMKQHHIRFFIDSILVWRPKLFQIGTSPVIRFDPPPDLAADTYPYDSLYLLIPDQYKEIFTYRPSSLDDQRIAIDTINIKFFSPLLPSQKRNIYFIHEYSIAYENWGKGYFHKGSAQIFFVFEKRGKKFIILDKIIRDEQGHGNAIKEAGTKSINE